MLNEKYQFQSEDEALARALAASMNPSTPATGNVPRSLSQEEEDRQLALALQQSEQEQQRPRNSSGNSTRNCNVS
jgi:hypothetical protein